MKNVPLVDRKYMPLIVTIALFTALYLFGVAQYRRGRVVVA